MKTQSTNGTTRDSLAATAAYNSRWFASVIASTAVLGTAAQAADWNGGTPDWNTGSNWSGGVVPAGEDAVVNTVTPNIATITADLSATPRDINIGVGVGAIGQVNHSAGVASSGNGNWMRVGDAGGTGVYNLGGSSGGGAFTGLAGGTGSLSAPGGANFYVGTGNPDSDGTININTTGNFVVGAELWVGNGGGVGTINLDAGTVTAGGWNRFGSGAGSEGFLNMSGGSFISNSRTEFGTDGTATVVQTGGSFQNSGEIHIGAGTGSATYTMSDGTLTLGDWMTVGRDGATGLFEITGGTVTKTAGGGGFSIAGNAGTNGMGTLNISGGLLDVQSNFLWVGQNGTDTVGNMTLSGTGEILAPELRVGWEGSAVGNVDLDGGILRTFRIDGNLSTSNVNFNGTQIYATGDALGFIGDLTSATIEAGNLKVNTAGFNVSAPQDFVGTGGVEKSGSGILTMTGFSSFTGPNSVTGGSLVLPTSLTGAGDVAVADGAGFGVVQTDFDDVLEVPNVTLGTSGATTLDMNLGDFFGNTFFAPLDVTGTLTLSGTVTVNIIDEIPEVGSIPLVSYVGPKAGAGSFVLGTLPDGVVATLADDGSGLLSLEVTAVAQPVWNATNSNVWDTTTENWVGLVDGFDTTYADGNPVLFNDDAAGGSDPGMVLLNQTVTPSQVVFENFDFIDYDLSGTGKISGSTGLRKTGIASLTISTLNDYSGATRIEEGAVTIPSISDLGVASPIGADSPLVFAGGSLIYAGPAATSTRGYSIDAIDNEMISNLTVENSLSLSGTVSTVFGGFTKSGAGSLTYSTPGSNVLSKGGYRVIAGDLNFTGGGSQTNSITGEFTTAGDTNVSVASSSVTVNGLTHIGDTDTGASTLNVSGSSVFTASGQTQAGIGSGTDGAIVISGSSQYHQTGGWMSFGQGGGAGTLTVRDTAVLNQTVGDLNIADGVDSSGTLNLEDGASITTPRIYWGRNAGASATVNVSGGTLTGGALSVAANETAEAVVEQTAGSISVGGNAEVFIGQNGTGVWNQSGGTVSATGWTVVGRYVGSNGQLNVSGGTFTQAQTDRRLHIGEEGEGVLNVSNTGSVVIMGNDGLLLSGGNVGDATVNLDGGSIVTRRVAKGGVGAGVSSFTFDGGLLKARPSADPVFISGVDTVSVDAGGGTIDTSDQDLAVPQVLSGSGELIALSGTGSLTLSGNNTHSGRLIVGASATVITTSNTVLANASTVNVLAGSGGSLTLDFSGNEVVDEFEIDGVPQGPGLYDATSNPGVISGTGVLEVVEFVESGYDEWIATYYPGETDPLIIGSGADPDGDGQSNGVEFALGGAPNDGSNNAKVYSLTADGSVDGDSDNELLMTIAVLSGTPAFTGNPSPSALMNNYLYTIEGSTTLDSFPEGVTPVATVATGLPVAPAGYEYRTFSLNGSNGLTTKGFLRVDVTAAP